MLLLFYSGKNSPVCVLQSLLGTKRMPEGSTQEKRVGIPNLNPILLF